MRGGRHAVPPGRSIPLSGSRSYAGARSNGYPLLPLPLRQHLCFATLNQTHHSKGPTASDNTHYVALGHLHPSYGTPPTRAWGGALLHKHELTRQRRNPQKPARGQGGSGPKSQEGMASPKWSIFRTVPNLRVCRCGHDVGWHWDGRGSCGSSGCKCGWFRTVPGQVPMATMGIYW